MASITSSNANGASVSYTYDDLDRLSTVVDNRLSGNNTTTYAYDPASNVTTATYANGVQSSMTYDALNRITGLAASSSAAEVSGYTYQRGPTGTLSSATELNGRTLTWTYDGIYRLTNEAIASDPSSENGSVAYGLDPVGNRLLASSSLTGVNSSTGSYNVDDEFSSETYDANGNTLTSGGKTFTYDAENHLTGMIVGSTTVSIVYDAFGNRVAKTVNGVTAKYLVEDDVNPTRLPQVMEEIVGGAVTRTYTYGLQRISENQIISSAWTPSFYGYDGAGSVRQLTNSAGAVTDTYEYDAFGNKVSHSGTTPNAYLYRGEQLDPDINLYYLRARYYNPATGRFLSRDPKDGLPEDPAALHKYIYANGDPVNAIDPTGHEALAEYHPLCCASPPPLPKFSCKLFFTVLGTAIGTLGGEELGGLLGGAAGAAGGTIVEPVGGTILGGVAGAVTGAGAGASAGSAIGGIVGNAFGNALCSGGGSGPPQKSPRCIELHSIVDGINQTIRASGGSCSTSLPSENAARLALWVAYLNARLNEHAECSQYDPNPQGHKDQIAQIWKNIIDCEVILHEF